jgi:hypothetical protein
VRPRGRYADGAQADGRDDRALLALAAVAPAPAGAQAVHPPAADYNGGKPLPVVDEVTISNQARTQAADPDTAPAVGTVKQWATLDLVDGTIAYRDFTLRALGEHIEIWVANDTGFPAGDCRNGPRTVVTDEQAQALAAAFDTNIYPRQSAAFSVPPPRDGSNAQEPDVPAGYWGGEGEDVVALVENLRDPTFYDVSNPVGFIGFFYSVFNDLHDRNIVTVDSFDWLHRLGATPPDEPVPGDPCTSAAARPFLIEGSFAHEYQHLLEHYEDPDELLWVNEGLSMWSEVLSGYADWRIPVTQRGFAGVVQCFLGFGGVQTPFNPLPRPGGPENGLTAWGDQSDEELGCDYGATSTLMRCCTGATARTSCPPCTATTPAGSRGSRPR